MAGDLVQYPGHVMMYLGVGDAIVHAVNRADDVELDVVSRNVRSATHRLTATATPSADGAARS